MIIDELDAKNNSNLLEAALAYAARGWRVFPCHGVRQVTNGYRLCTCGNVKCDDVGKHPFGRLVPKGCKDATTDKDKIRRWWTIMPTANIGIATGESSGVWVVDVDGEAGRKSLATLDALPETLTALTGREDGGHQYFFRYPKGSGLTIGTAIMPGIDYRGEGGYVIAPPSLHKSGKRYQWLNDIAPAEAPAWLITTLKATPVKSAAPNKAAGTGKGLRLTVAEAPEDFSSHKGAAEGERNDVFARLAGVHYARGDSEDTIRAAALAWNKRCTPPEDEATLLKRLRSAERWREQDAKVYNGEQANTHDKVYDGVAEPEDFEATPLPPAPPDAFPKLAPEAYQGLLGEIVRAIEPETEGDTTGILLSFLAGIGHAVGKGAWTQVGADIHCPNLFVCLVGDTTCGKRQTWTPIRYLLRKADATFDNTCLYGLGSGEGLLERVKDDEQEAGTLALPKAKTLLCIEEEFVETLILMGREKSTLSGNIRKAWSGDVLEVGNRKDNAIRASNAHITIITHITPQELGQRFFKGTDVVNGFANRFLWCLVRKSKGLSEGGNIKVLDAFADALAQVIAKGRTLGEMRRSPDAKTLWSSVYERLSDSWGKVVAKARPQVLRLSMLYALLDGSAVIETQHLRAALAVWDYCDKSAASLFDSDKPSVSPLATRLLEIIKANPGINRRGLHNATARNKTASELTKALAELRDAGLAHCRLIATEGRTAECWYVGKASVDVKVYHGEQEHTPCSSSSSNSYVRKGEPLSLAEPPCSSSSSNSYVRKTEPLSLAELYYAVSDIGGRLAYDDDGGVVVVDAEAKAITDAMRLAIGEHDWAIREALDKQLATEMDECLAEGKRKAAQ